MAGFFGPSEQDLEHLRSTVQSLGTTSVPGLAAALSWRERKTEKLLAHELGRPGTPVTYDPGRRLVRWARPLPNLSPAPVATPAPTRPEGPRLPPAPAPVPVFTPAGLKTLCPSCHVPLQTTGTASLAVCPQCGRLSSVRTAAAASRTAAPPPPAPVRPIAPALPPVAAPATVVGSSPSSADRRAQEMFAAWVTAKPIPCPKCRTSLRHRGVREYVCPSCGHQVQFPAPEPAAPGAPSSPTL
jgi:predicted RNA-binding Zn-ribbon protein involved in translation (DUF1610 family)